MPDVPARTSSRARRAPARPAVGAPLTYLDGNGLEIRFVGGAPGRRDRSRRARAALAACRREPLGDDPILHAAIATFASDLTLVGTILRRHGLSPWDDAVFGASLDHCMWFHRPFRADEWLLYDQTSPAACGARGLSLGCSTTETAQLVASVAQEGLVRLGASGMTDAAIGDAAVESASASSSSLLAGADRLRRSASRAQPRHGRQAASDQPDLVTAERRRDGSRG